MRHFTRKLWVVLVALPLIWAATAGDAMAASTLTGTIRGTIVDEDGSPLAGVTVTLQSAALVRERAVQTDSDGVFFAPGLAPGNYSVIARLGGYQAVRQSTEVVLDQTTVLDFILPSGEQTETVTVVATKPVVDKANTESGLTLNKDFTENLPLVRGYQNLLNLAPGVVRQADGNPNMLGGTQNANQYVFDGVSITDPVTGTFGSNINYDVIEAVDVKLTGVSAEYGGFQGGLTSLITRSGGNDLTGALRDVITSPSFEGTYSSSSQSEFAPERTNPCDPGDTDPNCFGYTPPSIPAQDPKHLTHGVQGTFGGPIYRDSSWFFISYVRNDNVGVGRLENGGTYPDTFQGDNSSLKLTYQATNNHKLQYSYFEDPADTTRCYNGLFLRGDDTQGCWDTSFVDFQKQGGHSFTGTWDGLWGNHVLSDVKITHWQNGFTISDFPGSMPVLRPQLIFESPAGLGSGLAAGNAPFWDLSTLTGFDSRVFASDPEVRSRDQYEASVTIYKGTEGAGSHTIKIGADYQEQTRVGTSILAGNALFYGAGWVVPPADGGDPFDPDNRIWLLWYDFAELGAGASTTKNTAVYVQDDWQLNKNFTFNLGVRFETNDNTNDVGEKVFDQTGWSPRLGVSWDVTGEGKHVVKGTYANYLDTIELTTLDFFTRAAGGQSAYDGYFNASGLPGRPVIPGAGESCGDYPGMPCWQLITRIRPTPDTNTFSPDLKPQSIDEYTLSYEHSFSPTLGASVRAIRREWNDIVGRTLTFQYDAGPDTIPGTADDGAPETLLFLDNRDYLKRRYTAFQVAAEKRFSKGWSLLGNYTWQKAEGTDSSRSTDQGFADFGLYPGVPQAQTNRFGRLPWSIDGIFNLYGSYNVPINSTRHGLTIGAGLFYQTTGGRYSQVDTSQSFVVDTGTDLVQDTPLGTPASDVFLDPDGIPNSGDEVLASDVDQTANINVYASQRGIFKQPSYWRLDTALIWNFHFRKDVFFQTRFEVFNVTNEQKPITVSTQYFQNPDRPSRGLSNYLFGYPTGYGNFQNARNYRVTFGIVW